MKKSVLLLATIAVLAPCLPVATNADTQVYDLNADWSDADNPNGPWAYREGNNLLLPAWWGSGWVGLDGARPEIFKSDGDVFVGLNVPGYPEGIPNILWTAPSTGTIDISGALWEVRCAGGDASSFWALSRNGNSLMKTRCSKLVGFLSVLWLPLRNDDLFHPPAPRVQEN